MRSSRATVGATDSKRKGKGHVPAVFTEGNCGSQTLRYHEEASSSCFGVVHLTKTRKRKGLHTRSA